MTQTSKSSFAWKLLSTIPLTEELVFDSSTLQVGAMRVGTYMLSDAASVPPESVNYLTAGAASAAIIDPRHAVTVLSPQKSEVLPAPDGAEKLP
jgi:hypothetical protein